MKTNLGVTAQALRHMGVIINNTVITKNIDFDITVPLPEAYVVHKMIINKERKNKQEKDAEAIRTLWNYLDKEKLNSIFLSLSKKELREVDNFIETYKLKMHN